MKATINIEQAVLDGLGVFVEQLQCAASYALSNLRDQETGEPIYFNGVDVRVIVDCPELHVSPKS